MRAMQFSVDNLFHNSEYLNYSDIFVYSFLVKLLLESEESLRNYCLNAIFQNHLRCAHETENASTCISRPTHVRQAQCKSHPASKM